MIVIVLHTYLSVASNEQKCLKHSIFSSFRLLFSHFILSHFILLLCSRTKPREKKKRMCSFFIFLWTESDDLLGMRLLWQQNAVFSRFWFYFGFCKLLNNQMMNKKDVTKSWTEFDQWRKTENRSYLNLWSRKGEFVNWKTNRQSDDGIVVAWPMKPINVGFRQQR